MASISNQELARKIANVTYIGPVEYPMFFEMYKGTDGKMWPRCKACGGHFS